MAYDVSKGYLFVSGSSSNNVSVINTITNSVIGKIQVGSYPSAIAYDQSNGYIDVGQSARSIIIAKPASTFSAEGYASTAINYSESEIAIIDPLTDQVKSTIDVPSGWSVNGNPVSYISAIAYCPTSGDIYFVNSLTGSISVIDSSNNKLTSNVSLFRCLGKWPLIYQTVTFT